MATTTSANSPHCSEFAKSLDGQDASPFLGLPAELRILIYQFYFQDQMQPVYMHVCKLIGRPGNERLVRQSDPGQHRRPEHDCRRMIAERGTGPPDTGCIGAILFVCRLVTSEALPLLYQHSHFHLYNTGELRGFLQVLSPLQLQNIHYIEIEAGGIQETSAERAFRLLQLATNLKRLTVGIYEDCLYHPSRSSWMSGGRLVQEIGPLIRECYYRYKIHDLRADIFDLIKVKGWRLNCPHCITPALLHRPGVSDPLRSYKIDLETSRRMTMEINRIIANYLEIPGPATAEGSK